MRWSSSCTINPGGTDTCRTTSPTAFRPNNAPAFRPEGDHREFVGRRDDERRRIVINPLIDDFHGKPVVPLF